MLILSGATYGRGAGGKDLKCDDNSSSILADADLGGGCVGGITTGLGEAGLDSEGRAHETVFFAMPPPLDDEDDVDADPDEPVLSWRLPNFENSRKLKEPCFFNELPRFVDGASTAASVENEFFGGVSPMRPSCRSFPSQPTSRSVSVAVSGGGANGCVAAGGTEAVLALERARVRRVGVDDRGSIDDAIDGAENVWLRLCELRLRSQLSRLPVSSAVFVAPSGEDAAL